MFGTGTLGIPVSTTHTITGEIVGVGMVSRLSAVRWGLTRRVFYAWVVTIPGAAAIARPRWSCCALPPARCSSCWSASP
ncbi:MAG: inorganic phosphate transporter [Chloroflexi bacterium]|nr:inorganic phosphate transporter [Chloroflexota bacterium]